MKQHTTTTALLFFTSVGQAVNHLLLTKTDSEHTVPSSAQHMNVAAYCTLTTCLTTLKVVRKQKK